MNKYQISACYFPTTVCFVDDREDYLESLRVKLDKTLLYQFYTKPDEAIDYFKNQYKPNQFIQNWVSYLTQHEIEHLQRDYHAYLDIDLSTIHKEIYSPNRFKEITVVAVDYAMPKMNGLEFSRQLRETLKDIPIKILMVTGQADEKIGIEALNNGIIDHFILKGNSGEFKEKLNGAIKKLQQDYFTDLSKSIIQHLQTSKNCALNDIAYLELLAKIKNENQIMESYLINETGCFLMLDINGNPIWVIIKNENDMQQSYQCLMDSDLPAEITQPVKNKEKLLFFFSDKDKMISTDKQWLQYLHSATHLTGNNNTYYYAVIKGKTPYDINIEKIASYAKFLETA